MSSPSAAAPACPFAMTTLSNSGSAISGGGSVKPGRRPFRVEARTISKSFGGRKFKTARGVRRIREQLACLRSCWRGIRCLRRCRFVTHPQGRQGLCRSIRLSVCRRGPRHSKPVELLLARSERGFGHYVRFRRSLRPWSRTWSPTSSMRRSYRICRPSCLRNSCHFRIRRQTGPR